MSDIKKVNVKGTEYDVRDFTLKESGLAHNGIYRDKDLGTITSSNIDSFISSHKVSTGEFDDLYIGDKITIQDGTHNVKWLVAGFDIERNKGNTAFTRHHVLLVPESSVGSSVWHASGTPAGYWGSDIRAFCDTVASHLANALGSHLLERRILPSTAIATSGASMAGAGFTGYASSWAWNSTKCVLLSEVQVYGTKVLSSSFYDVGEANEKLPLFNFISPCTRSAWWLRSVASSSIVCVVGGTGCTDHDGFTSSRAVRPLICIG